MNDHWDSRVPRPPAVLDPLFTPHVPDGKDAQHTLEQISADVQWLRAEMARVESSMASLAEAVASLVDAIDDLDPEEPDDPALTLDGEQAGQPRDQGAPL